MLKRAICGIAIIGQAVVAWAGGSGLNVVVVVNQNSTNSVQLGNDYCEKRGVPPQNLFRMTGWTGGAIAWSLAEFEANLRDPLLAMINSSGLTNQAQYVLLSMDIPYRVETATGQNATSSALFYGFKPNTGALPPGAPASCSLPDLSSNSFAFSEMPFEQAKPNTADTNSFLAFMLTDETLAGAESIISRALTGDASFPSQAVYLEKTSDPARNVRFFSFDNAVFDSRLRGDASVVRITSDSTSFNQIRGLLTGFANLSLPSDAFVPGALGDSLTSSAGVLFENTSQTTLFAFLHAGTAASYGTVVEPCNYLQKFPDPLAFFYQGRGFCAAEAYYLSLLNPFQGILVGDPLSAPFAAIGQASWQGLADGALLSGPVTLGPVIFSSAATNLALGQVDLFVDGVFARTLTNIPPASGNVLTLTLNGSVVQYTVPDGATISSVTAGLGETINGQSNATKIAAIAFGDRLEFQGLDSLTPGSNILVSASAAAGAASALTTVVTPAQPALLDTMATGVILLTVTNNTTQGDWLLLQIVQTNGSLISVGVTNSTALTNIADLCQALINAVNATPGLQGPDGVLGGELYPDIHLAQFLLYARAPGLAASQIQITLTASADLAVLPGSTRPLQDNLSDLRPRDHLYVGAGLNEVAVSFPLDTTQLADGVHELALIGYQGTSVRTQTRVSRTVRIQNSSLSATLTQQVSGTNITLDTPLMITVTANTNAISTIELFSTGGSLGVVSNQSTGVFAVSTSLLGIGLHPFYALVTDTSGARFRTQSVAIRIVPAFQLAIGGQPLTLSWNSSPGLAYDVLSSTNLLGGFQKVASVTATGTAGQWVIPPGNNTQAFYRVSLSGN